MRRGIRRKRIREAGIWSPSKRSRRPVCRLRMARAACGFLAAFSPRNASYQKKCVTGPLAFGRISSRLRDELTRRAAIRVMFLVVGQVLPAAHTCQPCGVGAIPLDRLVQTLVQ